MSQRKQPRGVHWERQGDRKGAINQALHLLEHLGAKPREFPHPHHHKASNRARVKVQGRHYYLGRWGSPEVDSAYERLKARFAACGGFIVSPTPALTVAELAAGFMAHARTYYRHPDGTPTSEQSSFKSSIRELLRLHCQSAVARFGPLALKDVRQAMIDAGLSRKVINQRIGRIKRVFRWGVENELVPGPVFEALRAVRGLQAGRTNAPERQPIAPADRDVVAATLQHLPAPVVALVHFQLLTGCRPGEAVRVRACDVEMRGDVWVYRPDHHKNSWRGKPRTIWLGPRAQELLRKWLPSMTTAYLFSPQASRPDRKGPGERYNVTSYDRAVWRACAALHQKVCPSCRRGEKEPLGAWEKRCRKCPAMRQLAWHPNQLRHLVATEVRESHGLEAAQVLLGHSRADVTQVYAESNAKAGADVIRKMG